MTAMKRTALPPREGRTTWTYWVSRDSVDGELSSKCVLWFHKPIRNRAARRVTWVPFDHRATGSLGEHTTDEIYGWFKVYPETDLELIRVECCPSQKELDAAAKAAT